MTDIADLFGDIICGYSRAQAIQDGVLVDVSKTANEAGFKIPVAVTAAVWSQCVKVTQAAKRAGNDETGRLWDVLWMARVAALESPRANMVHYELYVVTNGTAPELVQLKLHIGPGDAGEPVITIMLPGED